MQDTNVQCSRRVEVIKALLTFSFFPGIFPGSPNAVVNITLHKHINDQILDYPFVIFSQL